MKLKISEGFAATLSNAAEMMGNKFVMIIDEWDAPIREAGGDWKLQKKYPESSAAESLMGYIGLDFDGLGKTAADLVGGVAVKVDTKGFSNDLVTFRDRDDVLTLLPVLRKVTFIRSFLLYEIHFLH